MPTVIDGGNSLWTFANSFEWIPVLLPSKHRRQDIFSSREKIVESSDDAFCNNTWKGSLWLYEKLSYKVWNWNFLPASPNAITMKKRKRKEFMIIYSQQFSTRERNGEEMKKGFHPFTKDFILYLLLSAVYCFFTVHSGFELNSWRENIHLLKKTLS